MKYDELVDTVVEGHKNNPIDIFKTGKTNGEYQYLNLHKSSYVRTVRDVDRLLKTNRKDKKILEIGAYLGPVSISLKMLGYDVFAQDVPEFHKSAALRNLYKTNGIPFIGTNLRQYKLPYESNYFDTVIICEVLEHLNFNPLPVLQEINRVLKTNGILYIGMPNQVQLLMRLKLLFGKSVHPPIDDFFRQLSKNNNIIFDLHWREYTISETSEMIERLGFQTIDKYYFAQEGYMKGNFIWRSLKRLAYMIPSFKPTQVVVGKKISQ